MPVDATLTGRTFATPTPYDVSRQKVADFARAVGVELDVDAAPFTFPIVIAFDLMTRLMTDPSVGIELQNVVHRDQRIEQVRPLRVGDRVVATLTVDGVRRAAGIDLITTRTDIATVDGEPVCTATATLVHRGVPE